MAMLHFILRRLWQTALVMLVIAFIGFTIQGTLGDPLRGLMGESVSQADREALREKLGLNEPAPVQFLHFLGRALQGDLGISYFYKKPAFEVILSKFPATFELVLAATFLIVVVSLPVGVFCAIRPDSLLAKLFMGFSIIGISIPVFLTGILLVTVFSVNLGWFPSFGRGELVSLGGWWHTGFLTVSGLEHLVLPAITLSSIMLPLFIRLVRAQMMEQLESEYVRYAWARGLHPLRIWMVHALKNAALPLITVGGLQVGSMIAYTILTETVFQWPGLGFMFLEAVNRGDTQLIIAYIMFVGFVFVVTNTIVDLVYALADPRVKALGQMP